MVYDILILGNGIAGLGCAISLARAGQRVVVVGNKHIRGEATMASAGILDPLLAMKRGSPLLKLALAAFSDYPDFIRRLQRRTGIKTDFEKTGMLYLAFSKHEVALLKKWYRWQKKLPLPVKWLDPHKAMRVQSGISSRILGGLYYPSIHRVNPQKLKKAMSQEARQLGVKMVETSYQARFVFSGSSLKGIQIGRKKIFSNKTVMAAGSWSGLWNYRGKKLPVKPIRGQICIIKMKKPVRTILHSLEGGYIVPWGKTMALLGSTVESVGFKPEVTAKGLKSIETRAAKIMPVLNQAKRVNAWSGLRPLSRDFLPVIGHSVSISNLYFATGYYRSGILIGAYVGRLLTKGILSGRMPSLLNPFHPQRLAV